MSALLQRLFSCFSERLSFNTKIVKGLKVASLEKEFAHLIHQLNHLQYDAFVCCLLTSGAGPYKFYGSDLAVFSLSQIIALFSHRLCSGLAGKPKVFLVQNFQRRFLNRNERKLKQNDLDREDLELSARLETFTERDLTRLELLENFKEEDIFVWQVTIEGSSVLPIRKIPSVFIHAICELLEKNRARFHIEPILSQLNEKIEKLGIQVVSGMDYRLLRPPEMCSTLVKKLLF